MNSALWMATSRLGSRLVALLGRVLVLAALLGPEVFGLYGVAMLVLGGAEFISRLGFEQALIQKHGDIDEYLDTAWTTQVARGFVLAAIVFLSAPLVATFFDEPGLLAPLSVLAVAPVLMGLRSIGVVFFSREFDFKRVCILELGTVLVQVTVGIGYALVSPTIWAFVSGNLAGQVFGLVASYALSRRVARFRFRWSKFRELFKFGFWVFVSGVLMYILVRGGDLFVGKLVSITALGVYLMAMNLATLPTMEMGMVVTRVTLPALSLIRKQPARLSDAFMRTLLITSTVVMGITAAIIALAEDFVALALDERWQEAAPLVQWLAIWGACRALSASNASLFLAIGRPHLAAVFQFAMVVLFLASVYPSASAFGALGVAACLAIAGALGQLSQLAFMARVLGVSWVSVYARVLAPVSAAALALAVSASVRVACFDLGLAVRGSCTGVAAFVTFVAVLLVWDRISDLHIVRTVASMLPKKVATGPNR